MRHDFIAVEGPIGVGKSTLAAHLAASFDAQLIRDTERPNPYLEAFYHTPRQVALHTQLHFLAARLEVLDNPAVIQPNRPLIADFLLDKDRLFAELNLDAHEWWMYRQIHDRATRDTPRPDLVVYLQAPLECLIARIERRGVRHEARIHSSYLQRVIESYERLFHAWTESPLMIINTAHINLADDPRQLQEVVARIRDIEGGRHYLNPAP